jgi:DNA-binding PadR family transcriptional regulator
MVKQQAGLTQCQFTKAPPRHFLYPALLLLLSEEPRHGYRLVDALLRLGFGPFDRPSVYRALAELEGDGLLRSWSASPTAGSTRHVYAVTEAGADALAAWMDVVEDERALLAAVLKRYEAVLELAGDPDVPRTARARSPGDYSGA